MCVEGGGAVELGSCCQRNKEPKGKCWTTGNLDRTSALYILIMPLTRVSNASQAKGWVIREATLLILPQPSLIPEIS